MVPRKRHIIGTLGLLFGALIISECRPPVPIAAAVELAPKVAAADPALLKELTSAFDRAEAAVAAGDVEALMPFYAKAYNYHGLKRSDVRRVWEEVFAHYRAVSSRHVFTELNIQQAGSARKMSVTCTGGLYGSEADTGKAVTIDSWVGEVHYLVYEQGTWRFLGNAGKARVPNVVGSAPHHPLF